MRRHPLLVCGLVLAALVAGLYSEFLIGERFFHFGDHLNLYLPLRTLVVRAVERGAFPLWAPELMAGLPVHADPQAALFYPLVWLHALFDYPVACLILHVLHVWGAGMGVVLLGRAMGLGWGASLFSGATFAAAGYFMVQSVHPNLVHTTTYVPWVLAALRRWATREGWAPLAWGALAWGLALLAGGVQIAYYALLPLSTMGAYWTLTQPRGSAKEKAKKLAGALSMGLWGAGLAAVLLIPLWELAPLTIRSQGLTLRVAASYGLGEGQWLQLLSPHLFGLPGETPNTGPSNFWETYGYVGVLPLAAALAALGYLALDAWAWIRRRFGSGEGVAEEQGDAEIASLEMSLWVAMGFIAWFVAAGAASPVDLLRPLHTHLPFMNSFRAHGRLTWLVALAMSLLAGWALNRFVGSSFLGARRHGGTSRSSAGEQDLPFLAGLAVVAIGEVFLLGLLTWSPESLLSLAPPAAQGMTEVPQEVLRLGQRGALVGLGASAGSLVLLFLLKRPWARPFGKALDTVEPLTLRKGICFLFLVGLVSIHLVDALSAGRPVLTGAAPKAADPLRGKDRIPGISSQPGVESGKYRVLLDWSTGMRLQNMGLVCGYATVRAYGPVMLRRVVDLLYLNTFARFAPLGPMDFDSNKASLAHPRVGPVARLFAARYVVTTGPRRALERSSWRRTRQGRFGLYENPQAMPLVYSVPCYRQVDRAEAESRLRNHLFDPAREALVAQETAQELPPPPPQCFHRRPRVRPRAREMESIQWKNNGTRLEATGTFQNPSVVVASVAHHPGWRAYVDGEPRPLLRAQHAFMGVHVPSGRHRVVFVYTPDSLVWGAALSGVALLALLFLTGFLFVGRRRQTQREPEPVCDK